MALGTITISANTIGDLFTYANTIASAVNTLSATQVNGGGLASGGGDLSANRTITVTKATNTDVSTGTDDTKAVTSLAIAGADLKPQTLRIDHAYIINNPNFNTVTTGGFYQVTGTFTNGPDAGPGFLEIIANSGGTVVSQYYTNQSTNAQYSRSLSGGTWTGWVVTATGTFAASTRNINTSGLATGGGDLSADRTIAVPKAANTDIITGTDDTKAVTPLALAYPLSLKIAATRTISTAGLATGGGDLSADRTITVPKAANTDVVTGTDDTKAVTSLALAYPFSLKAAVTRTISASGLATGGGDLSADRTITVTKAANTDVYTGTDDTKAVTSLAITNAGVAFLTKTGQTMSGGARATPYQYSTGNITVDPGLNPYQWVYNNGSFTITAPSYDGGVDLLVINQGSAGAITFSGFTVSADVGDALTTTNGNKFFVSIRRVNGTATYYIKALQ